MVRRAGEEIATENEWKHFKKIVDRANKRIKATAKEFEQYNIDILPYDLAGDWQMKEDWKTEKTPISTSKSQFNSRKEFRDMKRRIEPLAVVGGDTIKPYLKKQTDKSIQGIESAIGFMTPELEGKIRLMNPLQQGRFWKRFHHKSRMMGNTFSSDAAMTALLGEIFPEDIFNLVDSSMEEATEETTEEPQNNGGRFPWLRQ